MGGTVAITLRLEDGTEYRMNRWTNSFPTFVNALGFIEKDPEHIKNYMQSWFDMKDDWERNKDGKPRSDGFGGTEPPYEHNMTDMYAPYPAGLQPVSYGLLVLDMQKNVILTNQGYSVPGIINASAVRLDMEPIDDGKVTVVRYSAADNFLKLSKAGRIKRAENPKSNETREFDLSDPDELTLTLQHMFTDATKEDQFWSWAMYEIDMSPFVIENFGDGAERMPEMAARVKDLGFEITKEEQAGWYEWIGEHTS